MDSEPQHPEPGTQIPPGPPLKKGGEDPLLESLAWLDFCLGETRAALEAVKAAALADMCRGGEMSPERYAGICEAGARIITLRGMAKQWGGAGSRLRVSGFRREEP